MITFGLQRILSFALNLFFRENKINAVMLSLKLTV